jgi:hypothetical protein
MRFFIPLFLCLLFVPAIAFARPVSYPGGWTVMLMNDVETNSSHIHYSPTPDYSVGWRHEYFRDPSVHSDTAQLNYLVKRWNKPKEQANIYFKSGVGVAYDSDEVEPVAFAGVAADWETRRLFTSYENRFYYGGDLQRFAKHEARVGVAPYIGDYGDLHTWLMLKADYDAGQDDSFSVTPMVRFFKGATLVEAGYNLDGGAMVNFVQRF